MNLEYNENEKLISDNSKTNNDYKWKLFENELDPLIDYKDDVKSDIILKNKLEIPANGEATKRLDVSQYITPKSMPTYQNDVGIISYTNEQKIRNGILKYSLDDYKRAGTKELFTSSETIYILVPFGKNKK